MEKVRVDAVEQVKNPYPRSPGPFRVGLALGATDVGLNYFELDAGEAFSGGYHTHHDQEEIFYVQSGTATFETEAGTEQVAAGEIIRFAPGEFQHGYNDGTEPVSGLAIGAPFGSDDVEILKACPACGERTFHRRRSLLSDDVTKADLQLLCPECGTEMIPTNRGEKEEPER
ncbi:cupin domain-containing protein [Haladaptatus sp. ZSTT2]|uniref:cupin domain-containing protein n=1 Tax=Haladaptatus sp. ZSTT2 TaxID=3120515 RepID=UPI003FA52613